MNSKKKAQRRHAGRRAAERYGMKWNREKNAQVRSQIKRGTAVLVERQSLRVGIYLVEIDGQQVKVAWDKNRAEVASVLPLEDRKVNVIIMGCVSDDGTDLFPSVCTTEETELTIDLIAALAATNDAGFEQYSIEEHGCVNVWLNDPKWGTFLDSNEVQYTVRLYEEVPTLDQVWERSES